MEFPKKIMIGPDLNSSGLKQRRPAQFSPRERGRPDSNGPTSGLCRSAAGGGRRGKGRPGPSDQVQIDGLWPSSSYGHGKQRGIPSRRRRGSGGSPWGFPDDEEVMGRHGTRRRAQRGAGDPPWTPGCRSSCRQREGSRRCFQGSVNRRS
jgi:hypothetical protein